MKKSVKLDNLGCANCAAKMERDIAKLDGVESATISFMTSRLTVEADADRIDEILDAAEAIMQKYESDCSIVR